MRSSLSISFLLSCIFVTCAAQNSTAKFESHSRLVLVPVHVTDDKGAPIPNLTDKDFTVLSDGKPQTIASFEGFVAADAPPAAATEPDNPLEFNNVDVIRRATSR